MADARPFRGLRYDAAKVDPARAIAPPYDVISSDLQAQLYDRSPYNVVRVEYARPQPGDADDARYARAATDLAAWRRDGLLRLDDAPAVYAYEQRFMHAGREHVRTAWFAAVRLEPWDAGIIKPHERTLANPKADRMRLLRATRTQISPVYGLVRSTAAAPSTPAGPPLMEFDDGEQRHTLRAVTDAASIAAFTAWVAAADVYIADGHHRYETALAYRDEVRAAAGSWTGDEPEDFVLMALTDCADPGLVVLPTHRVVHASRPRGARAQIARTFGVEALPPGDDRLDDTLARLAAAGRSAPAFVARGLEGNRVQLLTLADHPAVEAGMPSDQPDAWKRLDVNVLEYGILRPVFGIDDAALAAGGAVTYTQDAREAMAAVTSGAATATFLLNPTPVDQVMAVADAGARMPQKSTYFYPKLPTGLVLRPLD